LVQHSVMHRGQTGRCQVQHQGQSWEKCWASLVPTLRRAWCALGAAPFTWDELVPLGAFSPPRLARDSELGELLERHQMMMALRPAMSLVRGTPANHLRGHPLRALVGTTLRMNPVHWCSTRTSARKPLLSELRGAWCRASEPSLGPANSYL
jgi:hypothetical protein